MIPPVDTIQQYAPNVAPQTIVSIIRVESGGNQFAIGVNSPIRIRVHPKSAQAAAGLARYYISKGYSVDLGLMQINSRNVQRLGYTIDQILEPGTNIKVGSNILSKAYAGAVKHFGPGQLALQAALSAYNTGNYSKGFMNGYVAKYYSDNCIKYGNTYNIKVVRANILQSTMMHKASNVVPANPYTAKLTIYNQDDTTASQNTTQPESLAINR